MEQQELSGYFLRVAKKEIPDERLQSINKIELGNDWQNAIKVRELAGQFAHEDLLDEWKMDGTPFLNGDGDCEPETEYAFNDYYDKWYEQIFEKIGGLNDYDRLRWETFQKILDDAQDELEN